MKQYLHSGSLRRTERRGRKLFKEATTENFPDLCRDVDIQVHELINPQTDSTKKYTVINSKSMIENFGSSKRKETRVIQGNPQKAKGRFLSRKLPGQKRVG